MKQIQRGFTLIELVMVIVILGILAAVAIPKFIDLSGDAKGARDAYNSGISAEEGARSDACAKMKLANPTFTSDCDN